MPGSSAISTEGEAICECCGRRKLCRMYVLQSGEAAFVCHNCRFPVRLNDGDPLEKET
jgi:hypothetical protein